MRKFLVILLLLCGGCSSQVQPPPKPEPKKKAQIEITGLGGTCLKCGKEFWMTPNEDGEVILTPLCPECTKKWKEARSKGGDK